MTEQSLANLYSGENLQIWLVRSKTAHLQVALRWVGAGNFSTQNHFLTQNDLFSTVLDRKLSLSAPGLLTWQPVNAFILIMKLSGPPACYSSTGRRFAMLTPQHHWLLLTLPKKKHLSSQGHTSGWMRMRKGCEMWNTVFPPWAVWPNPYA